MKYRPTIPARQQLASLAATQGGYFTSRQAAAAGYTRQHVDYHIKAGNFERSDRGLYRLTTLPLDQHDELYRLAHWSRDRAGQPQAVVSHASALGLHNLGDVIPDAIHLTVPKGFRKRAPIACRLHFGDLADLDIEDWGGGLRVTTPLRTLVDASLDMTVETVQLHQAVADALRLGVCSKRELRRVASSGDLQRLANAVEIVMESAA